MPRTILSCGIVTASIGLSHSTDNCSHEVFFNYEPPVPFSHRELTQNYLRTTCKRASVSPINPMIWHSGKQNSSIVASLRNTRKSRDPSPLLRRPSVYSCCQATSEAMRDMAGGARREWARHGRARLGTEKTPLRLLLRNRGNVFRCYSSCMA
jgi:hypothetical protein